MVNIQNEVTKYNVSKNIKFLLNYNNKTRKDVCRDLNIKYTTFCDWTNGKTMPAYNVLEALGEYFHMEPWLFYGNTEELKKRASVLSIYASKFKGGKVLDMDILKTLDDNQIRTLKEQGYTFRHRTLEEYIELSGGKLTASDEYDWGEPVGRETW